MPDIILQNVCAIPAAGDGYVRVSESVAADGALLFLFIEPDGEAAVTARTERGIGIFPVPRMDVPRRLRLVRAAGGGATTTIDLPPLTPTFPMVDMFPDGRVLVAGPRCSWRSETDFDRNGAVIDPKTGAVSRILLGDGIEDVFVDTRGRIWVGYFDEGVFGNFGWSDPGPSPIGAAGLVCFAETGEKIWEYDQDRHSISDCYALNVHGDEAAAFIYTDFPVCTVSGEFSRAWFDTGLAGCKAFAISGHRVLFSGQYSDSAHIGYRGVLNPDRPAEVEQVNFLHSDGTPVAAMRIIGRGNRLYFFATDAVFMADIA